MARNNYLSRLFIIKFLLGLVVIISLLMGVIYFLVQHNEQKIMAVVKEKIATKIQGEIHIEKLETSFLSRFPKVSVVLKNVYLRDSLYPIHHKEFLRAENIFVIIDLLPLLSNKVALNEIVMQNGKINLYTDSTGYTNFSVFRRDDQKDTAKKKDIEFKRLLLEDVNFVFINEAKFKNFDLLIHSLSAHIENNSTGFNGRVKMNINMKEFNFNVQKGSYIKGRTLKANINISYEDALHKLSIPQQEIKLDDQQLSLKADFSFHQKPANFIIHLSSDELPLKTAASYLSPNISRHFKQLDFEDPINVNAEISGVMRFRAIPHVVVRYSIDDNTMQTPLGQLDNISFTGLFNNACFRNLPCSDINSIIDLRNLKASFQGIPFQADSLLVVSLIQPKISTHITSSFDAVKLNNFFNGSDITMGQSGKIKIDISYKGGASQKDTLTPNMYGYAKIIDASMTYGRRALQFNNLNAHITFNGPDVILKNISTKTYSSHIAINGVATNFMNVYYKNPEAVNIIMNVNAPQINLAEFINALNVNALNTTSSSKESKISYARAVSNAINKGTIQLNTNIKNLRFKNFNATDILGNLKFSDNDIILQNFSFHAAKGHMQLNGKLSNNIQVNDFGLELNMNKVSAPEVFAQFDNFGMQSLSAKNLEGLLSVDGKITGQLTDKGTLVSKSLNGDVQLTLVNGELENFQPIQKIGNLIFKKRRLEKIQIKNFTHPFHVRKGIVYIKPWLLETSAFYINVQGQYGTKTGTDLLISVPLRNPKKDDFNPDSWAKVENFRKGLVINLRAKDDAQGNLSIGWDPNKTGGGVYSENPEAAPQKENTEADSTKKKKGFIKKIIGK